MRLSIIAIATTAFFLSACSQESKVSSAIKSQVQEQFLMGVTKEFKGSDKSKVWNDLKDLMVSKTTVNVDEVKVEGDSAKGIVSITSLDSNTTGGLMLLLAFGASELDKKGMGLKDAWDDMRKQDKRMPAMSDYPIETRKFSFTASKEDGWKLKDLDIVKEAKSSKNKPKK